MARSTIRKRLSDRMRLFLTGWVIPRLARPRVIWDRNGLTPYLSRYYLFGGPRAGSQDDEGEFRSKLPVNLHQFHRGDDDEQLHNHPWRWSFAVILAGGYREERRRSDVVLPGAAVVQRDVLPFTINVILGDDFHRVDLLEDDAWSLFVAGPKRKVPAPGSDSWGFWDRRTDRYTPWRTFIAQKRGIELGEVPSS